MNWYTPCAYNEAQKRSFHTTGRKRLKALAAALGLEAGAYDVRSNLGGTAVSGEVTLHGEHLYVQICQPATGWDSGILIRTCQGRKDYTGGANHFAPLSRLDDIPRLAHHQRRDHQRIHDRPPRKVARRRLPVTLRALPPRFLSPSTRPRSPRGLFCIRSSPS